MGRDPHGHEDRPRQQQHGERSRACFRPIAIEMRVPVLKLLSLLALALHLTSCATVTDAPGAKAVVEVGGVIIRNELGIPVSDVRILAVTSGDFVTCGNIMARSTCSTGFSNRYYSSGKLQVTWKEYLVPQSTDEFALKPGGDIDVSRPAQVEVTIFSPGQAGVRLVQ